MWSWLVKNRAWEWVFSGVGVSALGYILVRARKFFGPKHEPLPTAEVSNVTQQPTITNIVSPSFTISQQVANPDVKKGEFAASSPTLVKGRANLSVEATWLGKIYLRDDTWTKDPMAEILEDIQPYRALLMDIANVPTLSGNIGVATVKGVLKIQGRSYSPLAWLETYSNVARFEPADRKTVVLAVMSDRLDGAWRLVLNPRNISISSSRMDCTNLAPLNSDSKAEVLLVDSNTGELLVRFGFRWTLDLSSGSPVLQISDGRYLPLLPP